MDTWMGRSNEPLTLHKYIYAHADPTYFIDPSGNFVQTSEFSVANSASISIQNARTAVGLRTYIDITSKLTLAVGTMALPTMLESSPAVEFARQKLKTKLEDKVRAQGRSVNDLLFHYTDEVGARGIMSCMCITPAKPYNHPDGKRRPWGAYATELPPWIPTFSQSDLLDVLYNKPRSKVATHYVAILKDNLWRRVTGVEWAKSTPLISGGPNGFGVQVFVVGSGANLMRKK